jgi:small subunit ribosomal protein S13
MLNKCNLILEQFFFEYGIGLKIKKDFIKSNGINSRLKFKNIKKNMLVIFKKEILKVTFGYKLKKIINNNILYIKMLGNFKGLQHKHKHPVRGQRTRRNGKTNRKLNR